MNIKIRTEKVYTLEFNYQELMEFRDYLKCLRNNFNSERQMFPSFHGTGERIYSQIAGQLP